MTLLIVSRLKWCLRYIVLIKIIFMCVFFHVYHFFFFCQEEVKLDTFLITFFLDSMCSKPGIYTLSQAQWSFGKLYTER